MPWHVSTYWHVVLDSTMIGAGAFIISTTLEYRSVYVAELCGRLAAL